MTNKQRQIVKLFQSINPKTGKQWSKLGISKKVGVSRKYVYDVLLDNGLINIVTA